jgi:hypothetical protein
MPYCDYEIGTNCAATTGLDLSGPRTPATSLPQAAFVDAFNQVLNGGDPACSRMSGNFSGCRYDIREELHIMCGYAGDDPAAPACAAMVAMTASLGDQALGVAKLGLVLAAGVLIVAGGELLFLSVADMAAVDAAGVAAVGTAAGVGCEEGCQNLFSSGITKPAVSDPNLQRIVDVLYKGNATVGTGSTADAVRYTRLTGILVGNSDHLIAAQERLNRLTTWIMSNPSPIDPNDMDIAQMLANDLLNSLNP